jgi:hypothetical protein
MASNQQFLFAPEKPLVKRLGRRFFKKVPSRPGVYKMKNAQGKIVYVGKAKNLKQRLGSYRVANPERLGRRHLRLLQQVTHIEFDLCTSETTALKHEARLIRELKPKFNRAGVWPRKPQFLVWRYTDGAVEFSVQETPEPGWERWGPLGAYARNLRSALVRLIWLAMSPGKSLHQMPPGWMQNQMPVAVSIGCTDVDELKAAIGTAFWGDATVFLNWCVLKSKADRSGFERTALAKDLEVLQEFFARVRVQANTRQMALI